MSKKKMLMRKFGSVAVTNNTFIGGVSSVINTPTLLAAKLQNYPSGSAFDVANIQNFTIVGDDIECYIGVDYQLNGGFPTTLTYYNDYERCKKLNAFCFAFISGVEKSYYFPYVVSVDPSAFYCQNYTVPNISSISLPRCTVLGTSPNSSSDIFGNTYRGYIGIVYVNSFLQTVNSGSPDPDLTTNNSIKNITYVTDFTPPNPITDLTVGTISATSLQLNFTAPTGSTNAIDFYEVWVNGRYNNKGSYGNIYAVGLTPNTNYSIEVKPTDIYYNQGTSNIVTQTTNATYVIPVVNIVSYYKMENNVLDSVGTNNGTATAITYESGLVGQRGVFNGTSSFISIPDANNLSFTDGTNDNPFSIVVQARWSNVTVANRWIVNKRGATSGTDEWQLVWYLGKLELYLIDKTSNASNIKISESFTPVLNQNYNIVVTYDGSKLHTGLKMYVDNVLIGTTSLIGTYTGMNNGTNQVAIGRFSWGAGGFWAGTLDETSIFNKALSAAEVSDINAKLNSGQSLI